ncbi:MAG: hypothetical protein JOS17DRAFT_194810 [Linnemannia elongata]|nr:MAG: hypothetical protein JOS17DRAFT_194810 [Linnemannia elongata]
MGLAPIFFCFFFFLSLFLYCFSRSFIPTTSAHLLSRPNNSNKLHLKQLSIHHNMDTLIYPPAAPIPLILPRSLSFQAGSSDLYKRSSSTRKSSLTTDQGSSSPPSSSPLSIGASTNHQEPLRRQSSFTFPASTSLPVTYTFLPPSSSKSNPSPTLVRSQIRRQRRRHSVTGGGFAWTTTSTTLPPRHALHMPIMKISPLVRRREQHQRNIHRLMHEGREVEVMRRRGIATVMDTSEEGDEEEDEGMAGVVFTGASIQQQQQAQSALDVSWFFP